MNLMKKNNLLDVHNIFTSRNNLMMKSSTVFDSNNVDIECQLIEIDILKFNNHPIEKNSFIQCDAFGFLNTDFRSRGIPSWFEPNIQDIDVTLFNNDLNVLTYTSLCNIVVLGDYYSLCNKPYLWNHHDSNEYCTVESNLKDVYNINSLYDSLGFNAYAKCNVDPIMSFSNLYLNNINLSFILNRSGLLDNTMNTIFNPTNIPHVTNERFGIGLMTNNPRTTYDMSTSFFFNSLFNELNDLYNSKNQNYNSNVLFVIEYLNEHLSSFTNSKSNLSDLIPNVVLDNLEMSKMMSKISVDEESIHFSDLRINMKIPYQNKFYWGHEFPSKIDEKYINIENPLNVTRDTYFFLRFNRDINLLFDSNIRIDEFFDIEYIQNEYSDFPIASSGNLGTLKLYANKTNIDDTNNTFNFNVFRTEYIYQENRLDRVVDVIDFQVFLENLYATSIDGGSNLLKFSSNLKEMSNLGFSRKLQCYANLELQPIVYTSDYDTLFNTPNFLSCFSNDSEFISAHNNLSEFKTLEDISNVKYNLMVGSLAEQNIENVSMFGSNLSMDFLAINGTLSFGNIHANSPSEQYIRSLDNNGTATWGVLPEYDDNIKEKKGMVYMFDQLNSSDHNTYTIQLLHTIHAELSGMLDSVRTDIQTIRSVIPI